MSDASVAVFTTLIGVVAGGAISQASQLMQRHWQLKDLETAVVHRRNDEVRGRMDAKADEVLVALRALEALLLDNIVISREVLWSSGTDAKPVARALLRDIAVASGYLTMPLRQHVRVSVNLIPDVERLAGERWVDAAPWMIANSSVRWAIRNVERYLRGDTVRRDLGEPIGTYVHAWNDLQAMIEHQMEATE